jgi:SAM-dependent methyltransferase
VNRDEVSAATHGDLPFANPLDPGAIDSAVAGLELPQTGRALDVGCGAGELLVLIKNHHPGLKTIGIEPSPPWAAAARERGVDMVHEMPVDDVVMAPESFDLVGNIASSHAIGTWDEALRVQFGWARPGGLSLVGEGFWAREPSDSYLRDALGGATRDELPTHDGLLAAARDAGWEVVGETVASQEDWARYEETLIANGERALDQSPDPDLRAWVESARARWEHPDGKDTLGFTLLTLRRP